jgi:hypothetical protein
MLVGLLLAFVPALQAQSDSVRAVVEGRIVGPGGEAIKDAEIIWQGDKRAVLSREEGSFSLIIPVRGVVVVMVRRPGYNAQALRMDLGSGVWRGRIVLQPGSQTLPDLEVVARYGKPARYSGTTKYDGFFKRQKLGLGTFISRDDIERISATHTLEILRGIPGVHVDIGTPTDPTTADIRIPRCQSDDHKLGKVTVWIDGALVIEPTVPWRDRGLHGVGSTTLAELLSRISPSDIEMVEVYRGPGQIPGEFHWDGCAAIAIWTRYNRGADSTGT